MIISHRHRFIFLRTRLTESAAVELALSQYCGPGDVITPLSRGGEVLRRTMGSPGPRNRRTRALTLPEFAKIVGEAPSAEVAEHWVARFERRGRLVFNNHLTARALQILLPGRIWNTYFKFCVERNPWDKVAAQFRRHQRRASRSVPLQEFVLRGGGCSGGDFDRYARQGRLLVDRILRFDRLEAELADVARTLKLPGPLPLAGLSEARRRHAETRDDFDSQARERIQVAFARELALFGD